MEKHLLELRNYVICCDDAHTIIEKEACRFMTNDDYQYLFPDGPLVNLEGLVDILDEKDPAILKMLLMFSINIALCYFNTNKFITIKQIYTEYELSALILKFSIVDLLSYLFEIISNRALLKFLLITNVTDDLHVLIKYKSKSILIPGYWEKIYDNFIVAARVEEMEINNHCKTLNESDIHYWLFVLIAHDRCLSLETVAEFICDSHFFRSSSSYEKLKQLRINQMYGKLRQPRAVYSIAEMPKRPRKKYYSSSESEEEEEEEKKPKKTPCSLCEAKQPCVVKDCGLFFGTNEFPVCRYNNDGFHGCKVHDNALNKEGEKNARKQRLEVKVTGFLKNVFPNEEYVIMQGYRLDNMVFIINGAKTNTLGTYCVSDIPELNGVLSVSLRLYLYNYTFYSLGVVENMKINKGNIKDVEVLEDNSILKFDPKEKKYLEVLLDNNEKMTLDFQHTYLWINNKETSFKSTAIRIFQAWKNDNDKIFLGEIKQQYYYIVVGTRKNTKKYKAIKLYL